MILFWMHGHSGTRRSIRSILTFQVVRSNGKTNFLSASKVFELPTSVFLSITNPNPNPQALCVFHLPVNIPVISRLHLCRVLGHK
jgi:hypothetical protein